MKNIIKYKNWNEMNKKRDELHKSFIRYTGTKWELVTYHRWSENNYFATAGINYKSLDELIDHLERRLKYDVSELDICTAE